MRIERVLICIDGSDHAAVALQQGAQLARALGADASFIALGSADGPRAAHAAEAAEALRSAGLSADARSCPGATPDVVREFSRPRDLLAFGVETEVGVALLRRPAAPHALAASIARAALIAGSRPGELRRLLISVSGSPTSLLAARIGAYVAAAVGGTADILHVADTMPGMFAGLGRMEETAREFLTARTSESHVVQHCAHILEHHGLHGEFRLAWGDVVTEILRVAAESAYDLIVVGPPPRHPAVFSLALGDVTAGLIRSGHCSVLVAAPRRSHGPQSSRRR
jgi:nucleotide-binding universal stress UspA family protein